MHHRLRQPPTLRRIKGEGTVLDLGSGVEIDVLLHLGMSAKRQSVRLDMTDEMLKLANQNKELAGAGNVEFLKGFIEEILPMKLLMWLCPIV